MRDVILESRQRIWLDPDAPMGHGGKRHERGCLCGICGERHSISRMYDMEFSYMCGECVEENTYPYDSYPEYGEERYICRDCGELCEESVTVLEGEAYCSACLEERRCR